MTQLILYEEEKEVANDLLNDPLLKNELQDLNLIQKDLMHYIYDQGQTINRLEDNISTINDNVAMGLKDLEIANSYYFSYKSIILGGILGGLTASPLGILLGSKIGSSIAFSGALLGGYTGYKIQKI